MKNKFLSIIGGCLTMFCFSATINAQNLTPTSTTIQNLNQSNSGEMLIGNNTMEQISILVYPNPTNGRFTLSSNRNIEGGYVEFHTVDERLMEIKSLNSSSIDFDISNMPTGIYYVTVRGENFFQRMQVTKI